MTRHCPEGACPFRDQCGDAAVRRQTAAAVYANLGYAVYPASAYTPAQHHALGKQPLGEGGWHMATTDLNQVAAWREVWALADCNVGVATGSRSRLVVIDIDSKYVAADTSSGTVSFGATVQVDPEPAQRLRKWAIDKGVLIPGNVQVITPSGGVHVWLRMPAHWVGFEVPRRIGWLEKVDLLWDKQMTKAPPSVRAATGKKAAGEYAFKDDGCPCQVPEASHELMAAMYETPAQAAPKMITAGEFGEERVDVEGMQTGGIPPGQQNNELYRLACSCASKRMAPGDALGVLAAAVAASPLGDPSWPWTLDDLQSLVERAYAFIAADRKNWSQLASGIRY